MIIYFAFQFNYDFNLSLWCLICAPCALESVITAHLRTVLTLVFLLLSLLVRLTSPPSGQCAQLSLDLLSWGNDAPYTWRIKKKKQKNMQRASFFNNIRLYAFMTVELWWVWLSNDPCTLIIVIINWVYKALFLTKLHGALQKEIQPDTADTAGPT